MKNLLTLVNEHDIITGYENKLKVHEEGLLHRAFSVFIINSENQILLQRRNFDKYHSGGLWSNTCCSHDTAGHDLLTSVHRRLREEMGFDCYLTWLFSFHYETTFENGLKENELDHVYLGFCDENPKPDRTEVQEWKWMNLDTLKNELALNSQSYTYWLRYIYERFYNTVVDSSLTNISSEIYELKQM